MRTLIALLTVIAAVCAPQAAPYGKTKKKTPVMGIEIQHTPSGLQNGVKAELRVVVEPPPGIRLNRYPGITLQIDKARGVELNSNTAFVGVTEPIADVSKFGFETIDPLVLEIVPRRRGHLMLQGTLKFFYCVKKSGYCAPGKQKIKIPLDVH